MLSPKVLEDLARQTAERLPEGVRAFQQDVERNVRMGLQSAFQRMDLVTREEFDVQAALLARTQARVEELAARVAELEARRAEGDLPR